MTEILDSQEDFSLATMPENDDSHSACDQVSYALTVVVPTRNEADNVAPLVDALITALAGVPAEVIFVDDSDDDTAERVRDTATMWATEEFAIRLIERHGTERTGGLSGAVLAGARAAVGQWVCVMDGDLQHPPAVVRQLMAAAEETGADLVTASRYRQGGSNGGLAQWPRKVTSTISGRAARMLFRGRLADVTDPMSGFFLVDTSKLDLDQLRPRGFKILLEIMISHPELRLAELPFEFAARVAGTSKANATQAVEFGRQIVALRKATRPLWRYDVHGLIGVESDRALPELEKFLVRSIAPMSMPMIAVRVDDLGDLPRGESVDVTGSSPTVSYRERTGFAMSVNVAPAKVSVAVSPFVARSPHVMYTNVVEPILRWQLVELGYALVHAACFADGDNAYLVTARTDTGKTTTMLKVLDHTDLRFVSDDLIIMSPDGIVRSFPKPLTISAHTVHALKDTMLNRRERIALVPQSRIHSREGRLLAFLLTKYRLPVASINALIQLIVPPPKYHVERIVRGVESTSVASAAGMFVIQRGGTGDESMSADDALTTLLANCDDAFGFPPYSSLERLLLAVSTEDLRTAEREIIASAIGGLDVRLMRSDTLDWAVRIPEVVASWDEREVLDPQVPTSVLP